MIDLTPERRAELRHYAEVVRSADYETTMLAHYGEMLALLDAADERDKLATTIKRVRALHERDGEGFCVVCDFYMTPHPCPTLRALDGTDA
mgnify:CR=1 FL=1